MTSSHSDRFTLSVLGAPDLRSPDGRRLSSILSQPKRLSLLTYLALSPAPASRASIVALFWPESDESHARNALSQAVHHLRRSLGDEIIQGVEGDRLWTPPDRLWCDARELLTGELPDATLLEASGRDLLEGWNADESQPLQEWLEARRRELRERGRRASLGRESPGTEPAHSNSADLPRAAPSPTRVRHRLPWTSVASLARRFAASNTVRAASAVAVVSTGIVLATTSLAEPPVVEMAVLLPRVTAVPGVAIVSPQFVLEEMLAHLPDRVDLRVVPTTSASSASDLRRQLATIGAPTGGSPDWILEVSLRVTSAEVRVVGFLYRSPTFDVRGRESVSINHRGGESVLVQVPREVAGAIAEMVDRVLAEDRSGRP